MVTVGRTFPRLPNRYSAGHENTRKHLGNYRDLHENCGVRRFVVRNSSHMPGPWQRDRKANRDEFMTLSRNPLETLARAPREGARPSPVSSSEGVDPGGEPRQLARDRGLVA